MGIAPSRLGLMKIKEIEGVPPMTPIDPFMKKVREQLI